MSSFLDMIAFDLQNSTLQWNAMDAISPHDLERAKQRFYESGMSVADWARARGFNLQLTYSVLSGRLRARRGQAHHIAVALGLKIPPDTASSVRNESAYWAGKESA